MIWSYVFFSKGRIQSAFYNSKPMMCQVLKAYHVSGNVLVTGNLRSNKMWTCFLTPQSCRKDRQTNVTSCVISPVIELCIGYFRSQRRNTPIRIREYSPGQTPDLGLNFKRVEVFRSMYQPRVIWQQVTEYLTNSGLDEASRGLWHWFQLFIWALYSSALPSLVWWLFVLMFYGLVISTWLPQIQK